MDVVTMSAWQMELGYYSKDKPPHVIPTLNPKKLQTDWSKLPNQNNNAILARWSLA